MFSAKQKLSLECAAIFGVLPLVISLLKLHSLIHPLLWAFAAGCYILLRKKYAYRFLKDWNFSALTAAALKPMLARFFLLAIALTVFAFIAVPDKFMSLPLERPYMWVLVLLLYPVLSVIPQEIMFRSFFFARYRALFSEMQLLVISSLAFGWMHIILQNWVAVIFSALGGLMFGHSYRKHHSLAAACLEHALYGCWVFTLGLGVYFYHGMAVK